MMRKILVIRLGSLGDVLLTSPTVLNLKISFPESKLTYLTKERFRSVVERFDGVGNVVTWPENMGKRSEFLFLALLRKMDFDIVVDLHGNPRSWLTRKILPATHTVVYPKRRWERRQAVDSDQLPQSWPHTIDLYNDCLRQLGGRIPAATPIIIPDDSMSLNPDVMISLNKKGPTALIAPGAAHSTKAWPVKRFAQVAEQLHRDQGIHIIWARSSFDNVDTEYFGSLCAEALTTLTDWPIEKLASVIARCRLTIANDSGLAHLSSSVGTPVIALFGPTHPVLGFAPAGLFDRVLDVDESCRPCSLHGSKSCHREKRVCFDRLAVERVVEAACGILTSDIRKQAGLFVDRDGTLIVDKNYLKDPDGVEFEEGAIEALKRAHASGLKIVVVSNQSGVARGYFSIDDVERVNRRLLEMLAQEGIELGGLYYCPHHPDGSNPKYTRECRCRKPAPGMLHQAAIELGIDLRKSWVVGDKIDDVNLSRVVGARSVLVRTGYGREEERRFVPSRFEGRTIVADNLLAAVREIERVGSCD
ncbi:MAG: HAD-IIIA family hydrolase [candidate division Zixibacteria bacterium]|nr:HAD-IIIA family hydrolase [candidate division Zixibacteria bacterium]